MFPERTRAHLEQQSEANLPDTCEVLARKKVRQPGGIVTEVYTEVAWDIPCALTPASRDVANEAVVGAQVVETSRWQLRVPRGTSVPVDGRIRVRVLESGETILLAVEKVLAPRTEESARFILGTAIKEGTP